MRFGLAFAHGARAAEPAYATALARTAEDLGYESVWSAEHVLMFHERRSPYPYTATGDLPVAAETPFPDPLLWLAHVAATTTRLRLGTGILVLPLRHPVLLAKQAATLDRMSGGRLLLGVGIGWLEEEFDAVDVPFARRGARTDESIQVLRTLWAEDDATHDGEVFSFRRARCEPKPVRPAGVPVHVAGHSEAAARRAGRLGDGFFPLSVDNERLPELITVARQEAERSGRDPDELEVTVIGPWDAARAVEGAQELGAHRYLVIRKDVAPAEQEDLLGAFRQRMDDWWDEGV